MGIDLLFFFKVYKIGLLTKFGRQKIRGFKCVN